LKDDLLDVYGDPAKFGKQVGGDIISNKKTFLLIEALSKADAQTRNELDNWIGQKDFDKNAKVNAVTGIYEKLGIRAFTEQKIQEYFTKGLSSLHALKIDEQRKQPLLQFAEQLVKREK